MHSDHTPTTRTRVTVGAVAVAVFVLVAVCGLWIKASAEVNAFDTALLISLADARSPLVLGLAQGNAIVFGTTGAIVVALVLAVFIGLFTKSATTAVRFAIVVAAGWVSVEVTKHIVQRPRPVLGADYETGPIPESFSYPSGHTAFATALAIGLLSVYIWRRASHRAIAIVVTVGVILAVGTALCRMVLGVHNLTDVSASIILVSAVSTAVMMLVWPKYSDRAQS